MIFKIILTLVAYLLLFGAAWVAFLLVVSSIYSLGVLAVNLGSKKVRIRRQLYRLQDSYRMKSTMCLMGLLGVPESGSYGSDQKEILSRFMKDAILEHMYAERAKNGDYFDRGDGDESWEILASKLAERLVDELQFDDRGMVTAASVPPVVERFPKWQPGSELWHVPAVA